MECKGLHHVAMSIQDRDVYDRTVKFYHEVLGLPVLRQWTKATRHITMLDFGNTILEIVFGAEGSGTGTIAHMAVNVSAPEDVDKMLERCLAAGCRADRPATSAEVLTEREDGQKDGGTIHLRNGFCIGHAGELIEFYCEF